jgi:1-deoxy-D-xylulose-5-phosphate synthase
VAIRYPRGSATGVPLDPRLCELPVGKAEILQSGKDVAILGIGSTVYPVLEAAAQLASEGLSCSAVNSRFIKPIDDETIRQMAQQCRLIVTVEENVLQGGFGSAVLESLQQSRQKVRTHCIGIPDAFVEQGPQTFLRKKYGLNRDNIVRTVKQLFL